MTVGAVSFGSRARLLISQSEITVCGVNAAVKVSNTSQTHKRHFNGHAKLDDIFKTFLLC